MQSWRWINVDSDVIIEDKSPKVKKPKP